MPITPFNNWAALEPSLTPQVNTVLQAGSATQEDIINFLDPTITTHVIAMMNAESKKQMELKAHNPNITLDKIIRYGKLPTVPVKPDLLPKHPFKNENALVGIEVEVENIKNPIPTLLYWQTKQDGSLRNNGCEFVSYALRANQIIPALDSLYKTLAETNKADFSNRTSIHIHLNCRDMTQDEIWNLVILYCIFEKHFYKVAGTKRLNSIFCVPIYRCNLLSRLSDLIYGQDVSCWSKYCGLNLMPLYPNNVTGTYGTIEFRHLYGTDNIETVINWIENIINLQILAKTFEKEGLMSLLKSMNTTSTYKELYFQFLNGQKPLIHETIEFESCISNVKRELFGNSYGETLKYSTSSAYWQVCRENNFIG